MPRAGCVALGTLLAALLTGHASTAQAQAPTCNADASLAHIAGPSPARPGDTVRVRLRFRTGDIDGGTTFTLNRMRFDLDCDNPPFPGAVGCLDDGLIIAYGGDASITTTCNVAWTTGHPADGVVNQVVFTPSQPIVIPANTSTFCETQFDVTVLAVSDDSTPNHAEQVVGYDAGQDDGQCNNGISSSDATPGAILLCPDCDDGDACTTEICNTATAQCQTTNTVICDDANVCTLESCNSSTGQCNTTAVVNCNDGNACTTESCQSATGQCQTTNVVVCTDNNVCTNESCNILTGQCETTNTVTCDDFNICTFESCNSSTGQCGTTAVVNCDDGNACTTESCQSATGQCQTTSVVTCAGSCASAVCNPTTGQCEAGACNDNDACTTETCNTTTGQCETTATVTCNDGDACTTESCNSATGQCQTTSTATCNDGNACTTEACSTATGQCQTSGTIACDGGTGCGSATCVSATGQCATGVSCETATATVSAGGAVTTDGEGDGPTGADPVETTVETPNPGTVTITETASSGGASPGYTFLGHEVTIEAPPATAQDPLVLVFLLDDSVVPPGEDATTIQVWRNGVAVSPCTGAPDAVPDPCVSIRDDLPGGDVRITVLSSAASLWTFATANTGGPVDGQKIVLKRTSNAEQLAFATKDPDALFPVPGGPDDPRVAGAHIELFSGNEGIASFDLPAGAWTVNDAGTIYKFTHRTAPDATSVIKKATLKNGKGLKIQGKAVGLALAGAQGRIALRIRAGIARTCARFAGDAVWKDEVGRFVGRNAPASAVADCSTPTLTAP